jgi:hypothetical protein
MHLWYKAEFSGLEAFPVPTHIYQDLQEPRLLSSRANARDGDLHSDESHPCIPTSPNAELEIVGFHCEKSEVPCLAMS